MNKIFLILTLTLFCFSCRDKFAGYKQIENGVFMQLISFNKGHESYKKNDYVGASITIKVADSLIYHRDEAYLFKPKDAFSKIFSHLHDGDSALFIISKKMLKNNALKIDFYSFDANFVNVAVKINHYYNKTAYKRYIIDNDFELIEQKVLKKYLIANQIDSSSYTNGIYKVIQKQGQGKLVKMGNQIKIRYTGTFINHLKFDETPKNQYLEFNLGTPNQVIKGIEIALKTMKKGETSKIIIPSQLAFGKEGSSTKIVPPYTTVIYNLEIIND